MAEKVAVVVRKLGVAKVTLPGPETWDQVVVSYNVSLLTNIGKLPGQRHEHVHNVTLDAKVLKRKPSGFDVP